MNIVRPGRYVLDAAGVLHPLRRRYHVDVVAIVNVRAIKPKAAAPMEAIEAGGCAPPVLAMAAPDPAPQAVARGWWPQKIDLSAAPSSMEQRAASWKGKA